MAGITWTKDWAGTDDGSIVGGTDLKNIQDDLSGVLTLSDIGVTVEAYTATSDTELIFWENLAVSWENEPVYG